jgi:hypothetical protein
MLKVSFSLFETANVIQIDFEIRGKYYKTYHGRNLQIFVIS